MNIFQSLCGLLAERDLYGHWKWQKVVRTFKTPIDKGQYFAFRKGDKLQAFVSYAFVSDEALAELIAGKRVVQDEDWQSGDNIFFTDLIAPEGDVKEVMQYVRKHFKERYGKGTVGHWYRPSKVRSGHVVA